MIRSIETLAFAVRLSAARVRLIVSAFALFNILVMLSRLANMMQQPFTEVSLIWPPKRGLLFYV